MIWRVLGIAAVLFAQSFAYEEGDHKDEVHVKEETVDYGAGHIELDAKERKMLPILLKLQKKYERLNEVERKKLIDKADSYREKFQHILGRIDERTSREFTLDLDLLHTILGLERGHLKQDEGHLDHFDTVREDDGHGSVEYSDDEVKVESVYEPDHKSEQSYESVHGHTDNYSVDVGERKAAPLPKEKFVDHVLEEDYSENDHHDSKVDYDHKDGHDNYMGEKAYPVGKDNNHYDDHNGHDYHDDHKEPDVYDGHDDPDAHDEYENQDAYQFDGPHMDDLKEEPFYQADEDEIYRLYRDQLRREEIQFLERERNLWRRRYNPNHGFGKPKKTASRPEFPYDLLAPNYLYQDRFLDVFNPMLDGHLGGHLSGRQRHYPKQMRRQYPNQLRKGSRRQGKAAAWVPGTKKMLFDPYEYLLLDHADLYNPYGEEDLFRAYE